MAARMRVLVVEDDASMRRAIGRLLTAAGYDQAEFPSAEELLASQAAASALCVVSDIHLPGMSGFDLVEALRRQHQRMPAVLVTAFDTPALRAAAQRMPATAYLPKPFEGEAIIGAIRTVTMIASPSKGF